MTIEERLEYLERELISARRHSRWALRLGVIFIVTGILCGAVATARSESYGKRMMELINGEMTIAVKGLILLDDSGNDSARLYVDKRFGSTLLLGDGNGKEGVLLSSGTNGASLFLHHGSSNSAVVDVGVRGSSMSLFNEGSKCEVNLAATTNAANLSMGNDSCPLLVDLSAGGSRGSQLSMRSDDDKNHVRLTADRIMPLMNMYNKKDFRSASGDTNHNMVASSTFGRAVELSVADQGSSLVMFDAQRQPNVRLMEDSYGSGLVIMDKNRKRDIELIAGDQLSVIAIGETNGINGVMMRAGELDPGIEFVTGNITNRTRLRAADSSQGLLISDGSGKTVWRTPGN